MLLEFGVKDLLALYVSPRGRIGRARYWMACMSQIVVLIALIGIAALVVDPSTRSARTPENLLIKGGLIIAYGVFSFTTLVLGIKRFHDRDKSGWWSLVSVVPLVGGFYYFVEVGLMRGTVGRNRYGDDPAASSPRAQTLEHAARRFKDPPPSAPPADPRRSAHIP